MATRGRVALGLWLVVGGCGDDGGATAGSTSTATTLTTAMMGTTTVVDPTSGGAGTTTTASGGASEGEATSASEATSAGVSTGTGGTSGETKLDAGGGETGETGETGGETGGGLCPVECKADAAGQLAGDWLLHIGNDALLRVSVADGTTTKLCDIEGSSNANSVTFTRDNRLMASGGGALTEIDPCTCIGTKVGSYPNGLGMVNGIAPDEGNDLFGISGQANKLIRIDADTAAVTEVGDLGGSWGTHGLTWSEGDQTLYGINGSDDSLYKIDKNTGFATLIGDTMVSFGHVGVEEHPASGLLFACSMGPTLVRIDKNTGVATPIGPIEGIDDCTNLGAPWTGSEVCLPIPG